MRDPFWKPYLYEKAISIKIIIMYYNWKLFGNNNCPINYKAPLCELVKLWFNVLKTVDSIHIHLLWA